LITKSVVIHVLAYQHKLVLAMSFPLAVIDGKALAGQMKNMSLFTFFEPENSLGAENTFG